MAVLERDPDSVGIEPPSSFALRYVVPGVVASLLITLGSLGVGWLPVSSGLNSVPLVESLRGSSSGTIISKISVLLGVGLLLQSWLALGYGVMHSSLRDARRLWGTMVAWGLPLLFAFPLFSRDVYSYFAQGLLLQEGKDPYTSGVVAIPGWFGTGADPLWGESPAPYGPLFLILERGVADFTGGDPLFGAYVFRFIAVIGVAMMAWGVVRLAQMHGIDSSKALWLVALNPLVYMHFVVGIHNDALMVGLITVAFVMALDRRCVTAVVLIALAGAVKPIGLLALPFIGLIWAGTRAGFWTRVTKWVYAGLIVVVVFAVLSLLSRTGLGWLDALATPGKVRTWLSPPTALGMITGQVTTWAGIASVDTMVAVMRALGQVAALGFIAWLALKPEGRSATRAAGLAFAAIVFLGPVVQPWYVLWGLPLLVAAGLRRNEFRIVLLGTAVFTLHALATSSSTQDTYLQLSEGIGLLIVAGIIAVVLMTSPRERRLLLGAPGDPGLLPENPIAAGVAARRVIVGPDADPPRTAG
ncbi:MAG: polyprenol phosphomannose-dependent alpha 1,6 mannosyltransferase MptB [Actinobacteria bacterium]|nr:polyprenol phosphomannose-dependent alpha 1,6 mannosyltransferase MptB [Actinomycetota bacterium]MCB9412280.1 polyprenol phosphomannose-dependent alpha 1,6 mannosyltransferase MptB [Actinomycetota bacterium]